MCDFDACYFDTCDIDMCDIDMGDVDTGDVDTGDIDTADVISPLNFQLASLLFNSEKKAKKKTDLDAERCDNMNMYSTGEPCKCNIAHHRAYKVMVIDVPQSNETTQKMGDSRCKSPVTPSRLTHHFVDVYFECDKCHCEFSCVAEFDTDGKHWYWHKIGESRRPLGRGCSLLGSEILVHSTNIDRSYKFVKQKYDSMPNRGCFVKKYDSIRWAKKFYNRLI
ncbi:hypothetical protein DdX_12717 [Ditylenchus destructor]|uniref:Uncharacterized protein n=1 Tax=Ditylenchus destructor TaxID=166010 RepID=A0AAD4MYD3_9BILA|nr:hypothetical protein DdX_12717 [Ditylenchus destructor]